ncbi:UNKNOWN [Stylonychia lemnae]|uniref:Transmembrane protein 135 N-terminal domain-containing protein n=1 Tax=Stylonychia lemnae TaxID=5949 RepID=A0A078A286_STYLE|nr:UNKNOWN [Stylonychia lemnae]|eukprot:CDW75618.1 UNKNOWN [Stylonychia lemnae]
MNNLLKGSIKLEDISEPFKIFLERSGTGRVECCHVHPGFDCHSWFISKFPIVFRNCLGIYSAIHILPLMIFKYKQLKENPRKVLKRALKNLIRSTLFLTFQVMLVRFGCCYLQRIFGSNQWVGLFTGILSTSSIIFEEASRRVELTLYVVPKVVQTFIQFCLRRNNFLRQTIGSQVSQNVLQKFCLAIGMGLLSVGAIGKDEFVKKSFANILKGLWQ